MNSYEGVFIFKPDLSKDEFGKVKGHVNGIIEKTSGSVISINEWGKQKLAYPIKKYKEGFYCILNFNMDAETIAKVRRSFSLDESILRTLIVRK